ncbi:unannotated protein [freshwater metagenome]|uniref:Unannotated protein n=1 Tax=freshwater metagenome TaxID=449393 RepID=A0A6J7DPQ6_9ZZZZ
MPMEFAADARFEGGLHIVAVRGELDVHTAPILSSVVLPLIEAGTRVAIEMSAVGLMDSTGLASLVGARAKARDMNGYVCLVSPTERVEKVLQITGMDTLIDVFDSIESAQLGR